MLFSFSLFSLQASGAQEDPIITAQQLIEQKEYNQALKTLTEILKTSPDRMDDVQVLLNRIRLEKENYNDRYEELIDVYGGEDVEAAYPIIKELEEMDPNPNEATRISLVLARETAGFVFNNNRWVRIMEDAAAQIAEEDYAGAAGTYETGFDLSRDIFRDGGYGSLVIDEVFDRAETMNELTDEFIGLSPLILEKDSLAGEGFAQRRVEEFLSASEDLLPDLARTAEIRELLKDTADYFIVQEEAIRNSMGTDKQIHYLIYMDRLLNGRTTVDTPEGIAGSIELFWNGVYNSLVEDSVAYTGELFDASMTDYNAGNLEDALTGFETIQTLSEGTTANIAFGTGYFESDAQYRREGLFFGDSAELLSKQRYIEECRDTAETFFTVIEKNQIILDLKTRISMIDPDFDDYRTVEELLKTEISAEYEQISLLLEDWQGRMQEIQQSGGGDEISAKTMVVVQLPIDAYSAMLTDLTSMEISLAASVAEMDLAKLEDDYSAAADTIALSSSLIDGIPPEDETAAAAGEIEDYELLYRYPDRALENLLTVTTDLNTLLAGIGEVESYIAAERPMVRNGEEVAAAGTHAADLTERSRSLIEQAAELQQTARDQIFTAEKLRQEGERRIEESKLLTQRGQFAVAKDRLEQAASKFDESLQYLEDQVLRTYRDTEIPRLYNEIQVAENNLVVRQVREYLTQGKSSYSQGNFPAAQSVLIKAQSRWSDTNVEPNPEVEYWLTLTQTALSVTSGRTIAATDPLYVEMNQYLNQARQAFQNAKTAYDGGRTADAETFFASAEQSLLYVQQFFPFNEEARVLNLRISQYRNPDQFREIFGSDFRTARALIATNPQKAYIDLKDLEAIEPDYLGLQAAITEAEYAAGIKVRPPDTQKLARSTELYNLAYDIVSRNVRSEFSVALTYLNEAISLNPNNNDAIRLKDRISTDVGGTAAAVMSSADQQLYNEAVREFTTGNYLKARIIVENLLKDPVNQRNPKLLDLQERIERTR